MRRFVSSGFAICFVLSCSQAERDFAGAGGAGASGAGASGAGASSAGAGGSTTTGSAGTAGSTSTSGAAAGGADGGKPSSGGAAGGAGVTCSENSKPCGGSCVPLTDPAYGCGPASCDDTDCPNPGPSGELVCDGASCEIGSCGTGFKLCDGVCVATSDPTYGCSPTSCDDSECPEPGAQTIVCEDDACVIGTCGPGTKKCGGKCVPTDRNNGCAGTSCTACANDEECVGSPSACTCVPVDMTAACSGKQCGTASNGCGDDYTCGTCTALPNAVAACESNTCINSCAAGVMRLTCPNIAPDMPRCGAWGFETNTVEGWTKGDPSDAAITGKTTIAVSTARKVAGSRALMVTTTIPGGENPSTFDYEQMITFQTPLCPDSSSLNLTNRVFEVHAYFERISGTALNSSNATITAGSQQQNAGGGGGSVGNAPFTVAEGTWLSGTAQVSPAATHLTISVSVGPRLAVPWNGRIYFDVLALH